MNEVRESPRRAGRIDQGTGWLGRRLRQLVSVAPRFLHSAMQFDFGRKFWEKRCRHEWRHGTLKACATSGSRPDIGGLSKDAPFFHRGEPAMGNQ